MKKTHHNFPPEILNLFDKFVHGDIDRRGFIEGAGKFAISATVAGSYLSSLVPDFAAAQKISPDDARIITEIVEIKSPNGSGKISAYIARPAKIKNFSKLPIVIVCHENRGLNPHIKDIARRIALDNYIAIAPDALTALGGYPGDEDKAREAFGKLDQAKIRNDFLSAVDYAKSAKYSNGKIGVVGFCWGGGMSNYLVANSTSVLAAVPFYGAPAPLDAVKNIKGKILLHFAGDDERFNAMWPDYEKALKENNKSYVAQFYPDTVHGFNNDTTPRYNENMAAISWARTINFFNETLKGQEPAKTNSHLVLFNYVAQNATKGGCIILYDGNQIIKKTAIGNGITPLNTTTKVRIASMSKLITAFCAWKLAEQGKFDLDKDISEYIGFKLRNPAYPDNVISARHILSHTSTIRDDQNYFGIIGETLESFFTKDGVNWADGKHFAKEPIGYYAYSNLGMGLIAQAVENISGQRFDLFAHDNVIAPLGIKGGYNWSGISAEDIKNYSPLYRRKNDGTEWVVQTDGNPLSQKLPTYYKAKDGLGIDDYKIGTNGLIFNPQGGLRADIEDLAIIGQVIVGSTPFFSDKFRKQALKDVFVYDDKNADKSSELITDYATGISHIRNDDRSPIKGLKTTIYGHSGEAYGLLGGIWTDPNSQRGIAWFINSSLEAPPPGEKSGFYKIEEDIMTEAMRDIGLA